MEARINRILVVRNDSSTNWEKSSYILKKGELGVAFLKSGKTIVKIGNGTQIWNELPQSEYVFEEDMIISYDFGKYKADRGFVQVKSKGLTTSEWLKDCLINEEDATITQPDLQISATLIPNPSKEIGSKINTIKWVSTYTDGQYSYGSTTRPEHEAGTTCNWDIYFNDINGNSVELSSLDKVAPSTVTEEKDISDLGLFIDKVGENNFGEISADWSHSRAKYIPVNSLGKPQEGSRIEALMEAKQVSYNCSINGYREGCFYGTVRIGDFSEDKITNSLIRGLTKTGKNYAASTLTYGIKSNDTAILIAIPEGKTITSVLNTTVNAEMFGTYNEETQKYGNFKKVTRLVGGADSVGDEVGGLPINYDVYYYKPEYAYTKPANITIKLAN